MVKHMSNYLGHKKGADSGGMQIDINASVGGGVLIFLLWLRRLMLSLCLDGAVGLDMDLTQNVLR